MDHATSGAAGPDHRWSKKADLPPEVTVPEPKEGATGRQTGTGPPPHAVTAKPSLGAGTVPAAAPRTSAATAVLEQERAKWHGLWTQEAGADYTRILPAGQYLPTPTATVDELRATSLTFKPTTTKVDGWHPRQFAGLSDDALATLADLFWAYEAHGLWTTQQSDLIVTLLAKATGGKRPILFFRSAYRLWGRWAQARVKTWAVDALQHYALNNQAGRRPGDAIWRNQVRAQMAEDTGLSFGEVFWDMAKAFDRVPREQLLRIALARGYPPSILRLSLLSYEWARRIVNGPLVAAPISPTRGIGPGSPFATFELSVALVPMLELLDAQCPSVPATLHVDDLLLQTAHATERAAQQALLTAADIAQRHIESTLGMELDRDGKAVVLASSRALHDALRAALGVLGGDELEWGKARTTTTKALGYDTAVTRKARGRRPTANMRRVKSKLREQRLRQLRSTAPRRRLGRIYQGGVVPSVTYDAELHGLSELQARSMRYAKLTLDRLLLPGVAVDVQMAMFPVAYDPAFRAIFAPLERYHREVWILRVPHVRARTPDALSIKELRLAFQHAERRAPPVRRLQTMVFGSSGDGGPRARARPSRRRFRQRPM